EDVVVRADRGRITPGAVQISVRTVHLRGPARAIVAGLRDQAAGRSGFDHVPAVVVPGVCSQAVGRYGAVALVHAEDVALEDPALFIVLRRGLGPQQGRGRPIRDAAGARDGHAIPVVALAGR